MMIHSVTNRFQFFSFFLDSQILDLGCGDGAVGEALKAKGFEDLIGIDISKGMLDIAQNKGTYTSLKKGDLQQTLPFEDGTFDCAVSSAVSTYLSELRALNKFSKFSSFKHCFEHFAFLFPDHTALSNWIPVVKNGGYLCLVHKASVWTKWTDEQDRLEKSGVWNKIWTSKPLPFLPSLEGSGTDKAKIFIYQKV